MDQKFQKKYLGILDILGDVSNCAAGNLILIGGTALALFYLKHRLSVDLDFVPIQGDDVKMKEAIKGCLTKKGHRTAVARYKNQFVVHLDETSIKIEIFYPEYKIKKIERFEFGQTTVLVASLDDLLELKYIAYAARKEARDLFDILFILEHQKNDQKLLYQLITKYGLPKNQEGLEGLITNESYYNKYKEVIKNASP